MADIRYLRLEGGIGEVLKCAEEGVLAMGDYPKCRHCGGGVDVEFQIMPALLVQMDSDVGREEELDWGVLSVLTCKGNCNSTNDYVEEYLWRQEISSEGLKSEADMQ